MQTFSPAVGAWKLAPSGVLGQVHWPHSCSRLVGRASLTARPGATLPRSPRSTGGGSPDCFVGSKTSTFVLMIFRSLVMALAFFLSPPWRAWTPTATVARVLGYVLILRDHHLFRFPGGAPTSAVATRFR